MISFNTELEKNQQRYFKCNIFDIEYIKHNYDTSRWKNKYLHKTSFRIF